MEIEVGKLIKKTKVKRCEDGNYPILSMTMHDGLVFQNDRFKKQIASIDQSNYQVVKRHQLVESFPIDEGVLAVQELTDEGIVSPAYKIWDIDMDKIIPVYLEYALRAPRSIQYYKSKLRGTTARRRSITDDEFCSMRIQCPGLTRQVEIIGIIDKAKSIIDKRKRELEVIDDLIKARFVEMFGNGHDGICNTKNLGEFCKFQQGTQVPVEEQIEEQLEGYTRFLRIIDYTQAPQLPRYVSVKGREIAEDSVVIVRYGATAGFVGHGYAGILANNLFEVIPDESVLIKDFLYLSLKYGTFEQEVHDKAFGAAMPALSFGMMNDIKVVIPDMVAQKDFVNFVKQVDKSKFIEIYV